jgi:hypothetical protein
LRVKAEVEQKMFEVYSFRPEAGAEPNLLASYLKPQASNLLRLGALGYPVRQSFRS